MADREFVGEKWIGYLNRERIRYYIRICNKFKVLLPYKGEAIPVNWLFNRLGVGESMHYPKIVEINGRYCYLSATLSRKRDEGPELLVIISFNRNEQSFLDYRERWQVETLFKSLKSSGFDMENTERDGFKTVLMKIVM